MTARLSEVAIDFSVLLVELTVLIVVVATALALLSRRIGVSQLQTWLGGNRIQSALKGSVLGFLIPFCTYSAIPVLVGMLQARMRIGTMAGFLLAAPVLDPVVIGVLVVLFGWQVTLAYAMVTFAIVLGLSILADFWNLENHFYLAQAPPTAASPGDEENPASATTASCETDSAEESPFSNVAPWQGIKTEAPAAITYAIGLIRGLAVPMVIAVAIAAAIVGFVPDDFIARVAGPDNPVAVPIAAFLGAPFYVSTEAFLPIAAALFDSGMGIGAVFALVISASGVNIPELGLLSRMMSVRLMVVYIVTVIAIAVVAGFLIPVIV